MASTAFFHKPELALRRAVELENINQDDAALALLHEVLSSRRHRTWSPAYEAIMLKYVNLCLKLHKSREAKDGLHQYRNLSQAQAPGSLEKVILYLMEQAEKQCEAAKAFVDAETLAQSAAESSQEDDEFGVSPQSILLTTMSTDPAKSQRDSTLLMPALKFLWEIYRTVLDILRSNSKLEHVYHKAAQNALLFCRIYKRKMEFRLLCEILRQHLGNLRQYGVGDAEADDFKAHNKVRGWEGWSTESIELHLQTRFAQLETASELHRYQEGFRTVEDIYNILQISQARKKPPKARLMANYYEKLTTLFWVSENYLFHAFAWYKYYTLCREYNRGMSEELKERQASAVLLAALCIPQMPKGQGSGAGKEHAIASTIEDDIVKQKTGRMATLLGFHTRNPTREALLQEIKAKNILDQVPQYVQNLYHVLENSSDPLIMVEKTRPFLDQLKERVLSANDTEDDVAGLGRYVKPLTKVLLLKLVINLSSAYHTVSIDHLKRLTAGLDMSFQEVEKAIVLLTQTKALSVRIDHRAGCLRFGDVDLESYAMRSQLTVLAKQLEAVNQILAPADANAARARRARLYDDVRARMGSENAAILERKKLIEDRKEEAERLAQEKVREEARRKAEEEAARRAEDELRVQREQRLRELEKQKKIQQELEHKEKLRILRATMGKKAEELTEEKLDAIDADALKREHEEKIRKKKEEADRKQREVAKKLDYLVRAIRIEELPLIKKNYEERLKHDREQYERDVIEKAKEAKLKWESDMKEKRQLEEFQVFQHIAEFEELVMAGRKVKHEAACRQAEEDAEIVAERGKIERARKRKAEEARRQAEEEERIRREEEEARAAEERSKREELKREKEAEEEKRKKDEIKRMEEERLRKEKEKGPAKYVPPSRRGADGGGGGGSGSGGGGERPGGSRFAGVGSSGSTYVGGGRYDNRNRDRGDGPPSEGNSRWGR